MRPDIGLVGNEKRTAMGVSLNENTERRDPSEAFLHLRSPGQESWEIESQWGPFDWRVDLNTYMETDVGYNRLSAAEIRPNVEVCKWKYVTLQITEIRM